MGAPKGHHFGFQPGNKLGGRKPIPKDLVEAFRADCPRAHQRLRELIESEDERIALAACNAVLDRGYGKPAQPLEHSGADGEPVSIVVSFVEAQQ